MARKPETTWEMLNVAMTHFQSHINGKVDRCSLSMIDLLHVSNFKGGNASITEPMESLHKKLTHYERCLREVEKEFEGKTLAGLSLDERSRLTVMCNNFIFLTQRPESAIRGLGPSYASALLAAHFIELVPVLDRRALNGANISVKKDKQGQVKNMAGHYGELIDAFGSALQESPGMTLRELDKKWFSVSL